MKKTWLKAKLALFPDGSDKTKITSFILRRRQKAAMGDAQ